jgi:hypothetical protein
VKTGELIELWIDESNKGIFICFSRTIVFVAAKLTLIWSPECHGSFDVDTLQEQLLEAIAETHSKEIPRMNQPNATLFEVNFMTSRVALIEKLICLNDPSQALQSIGQITTRPLAVVFRRLIPIWTER